MNKETILAKVMEMKLEETDTYYNGYIVWRDKYNELVEALKEDIREENNKKTGRNNPYKLAKAILAPGQKRQKMSRNTELMAYAYTDKNGIKWVLDGRRIAGFFEDIDLPELPEEDRNRWFKVEKLINNSYDDEEIIPPNTGDIKANIKIAKAEKKKCIVVLANGIHVDAQYLLEYLEGFKNPKLYAYVNDKEKVTITSPIRIEADNGIGMLLPINPQIDREPGIYNL